MTEQPAPPTNATAARAALDQKMADKDGWAARYLLGGVAERKEFDTLTGMIAGGGDDVVSAAMAGNVSDPTDAHQRLMADTAGWLRDSGFPEKAINEVLSDKVPPEADIELARVWKTQAFRSPEFVKRFLAGEPVVA